MFFGLFKKPAPPWRPPAVIGKPLFKPRIVKREGHWAIAMPGTGDYTERSRAMVELMCYDASTRDCVDAASKFVRHRNVTEQRNRALATLGMRHEGKV